MCVCVCVCVWRNLNFFGCTAVQWFLKLECHCHGVSGSCTLRTCWCHTGDYLQWCYDGAVWVTVTQDGINSTAAHQGYCHGTQTDHISFDNSPDYLVLGKVVGSLDTAGHVCSKASKGDRRLWNHVCGREYDTTQVTCRTWCECTFHWCHVVQYKEWRHPVDIHTCEAPMKAEWLDHTWTHKYLTHPSAPNLLIWGAWVAQ